MQLPQMTMTISNLQSLFPLTHHKIFIITLRITKYLSLRNWYLFLQNDQRIKIYKFYPRTEYPQQTIRQDKTNKSSLKPAPIF